MPHGGDILVPLFGDEWEPVPPPTPDLTTGVLWYVGPLVAAVAIPLAAKAPLWVSVLLPAIPLVLWLLHVWKLNFGYYLSHHLYDLKLTSRGAIKALFSAQVIPLPDLQPLSSHYPILSGIHLSLYNLRNQTTWTLENGEMVSRTPDTTQTTLPSDEVMPLLQEKWDLLNKLWNTKILPGTCNQCRWRVWLYKVLSCLPI